MVACGQGYTIAGLSGTRSTKRAREKGGTPPVGVPPFPQILNPKERIAISPGVPPIWYKLVPTRENVRGKELRSPIKQMGLHMITLVLQYFRWMSEVSDE